MGCEMAAVNEEIIDLVMYLFHIDRSSNWVIPGEGYSQGASRQLGCFLQALISSLMSLGRYRWYGPRG
jgi:hypothetical protein